MPLEAIANNADTQVSEPVAVGESDSISSMPKTEIKQSRDLRWTGAALLFSGIVVAAYALVSFFRRHRFLIHNPSFAGAHHAWTVPTIVSRTAPPEFNVDNTVKAKRSEENNQINERLQNIHQPSHPAPGKIIMPDADSTKADF